MQEIQDPVFSEGALGECIGVDPVDGKIVAPADGKIMHLADTLHAVGIQAGSVEILIHVGIDTVDMNGEGFQSKVKEGQSVQRGQELLHVDLQKIKEAGHPATVIMIVTNTEDFQIIEPAAHGNIKAGEPLMKVKMG